MSDLRQLAEAATPGPWRKAVDVGPGELSPCVFAGEGKGAPYIADCTWDGEGPQQNADAAYIAAANPQAILALLDERDRLKAACEEMVRTLTCPSRQLSDITRGELEPWLKMLKRALAE